MRSPEDRDLLLSLGRRMAEARLDQARHDATALDPLALRLLRRSPEPLDRAAAWLCWAQRRPGAFLRAAQRALDDREPLVRAAVMEGVGLAGLSLGQSPDTPSVKPLLRNGGADSSREVRRASEESSALLARFRDAAEAESDGTRTGWKEVRRAFLEQLLPELGASLRELLSTLEAPPALAPGLARPPRGAPARRRGGLRDDLAIHRFLYKFAELPDHAGGEPSADAGYRRTGPVSKAPRVPPLLSELAPLAASVAERATRLATPGRDPGAFATTARRDDALAAGIGQIENVLRRHHRKAPDAWKALEQAVYGVAGDAPRRR